MFDYVVSLREGIMDAWGGIIGAMKSANKSKSNEPFRLVTSWHVTCFTLY